MDRAPPARSRLRIQSEVGRTRILVRPRRHAFAFVFLPVWIAGWALGEVVVAVILVRGLSLGTPFLAAWLLVWTGAGVAALYTLAYLAAGREELTVDGRVLRVRRAIGPFGRTREFVLAEMGGLRQEAVSPVATPRGGELMWPWTGRGAVGFRYRGRSVLIGDGLEGADVATVLELLRVRAPDPDGSGC